VDGELVVAHGELLGVDLRAARELRAGRARRLWD
jgi:hypothetical protein